MIRATNVLANNRLNPNVGFHPNIQQQAEKDEGSTIMNCNAILNSSKTHDQDYQHKVKSANTIKRFLKQVIAARSPKGIHMKTSQNGINLIKEFEGCKLQAYLCPAGVPTIGYGHTEGVKLGDEITQQQADKLLVDDLIEFENQLKNLVTIDLHQNQFDALISLIYNVGYKSFGNSNLLKSLNAGEFEQASTEFNWVKAKGVVLPGLVRRRAAEKQLFLS